MKGPIHIRNGGRTACGLPGGGLWMSMGPSVATCEGCMDVYVGQTRSRKLIARLRDEGFGECTQPTEFPPRRFPYMLDNGAFSAWKRGETFDSAKWLSALRRVGELAEPPRFAIAPDLVAGGLDSLALSIGWLGEMERARVPAYLAVQDGMTEEEVLPVLRKGFAGVFVGGTLPWKLGTGARWVKIAHEAGVPCHIGRVGTPDRCTWAAECGADSIDSCLPLWSDAQLTRFVRALRDAGRQSQLFARGSE